MMDQDQARQLLQRAGADVAVREIDTAELLQMGRRRLLARRAGAGTLALAVFAVLVGGGLQLTLLGGRPPAPQPSAGEPTVIVDGPVIAASVATDSGLDAIMGGTLTYEDGCLLLAGMPVIWPAGTSWDHQERQVVLADGSVAASGSSLHGGGGAFGGRGGGLNNLLTSLPPEAADLIRGCLRENPRVAETREVVVFNSGAIVKTG